MKLRKIAIITTAILATAYTFNRLIFLRNPEREIPKNTTGLILAPADGRIISIERYQTEEILFNKTNTTLLGSIRTLTKEVAPSGYIISIFMSPLDVHYNRMPFDGTIISQQQFKGKFLPANSSQALFYNNKCETVIKGEITAKIIQVSGLIARRIFNFVVPGQHLAAGEQFGLIKLGSQTTIVLPDGVTPSVTLGQKVKAGLTQIASIDTTES